MGRGEGESEREREREREHYLDLQYQDMQKLLGANTVAYLNVDVAVEGT